MGPLRALKHVDARRSAKLMALVLGEAQREANGLSPWRGLQRGRCMLQGSPCGASSVIWTLRYDFLPGYSMPAKSRLDSESRWKPEFPIELAQRFLNQGGSIKIGRQIFPEFVQVQTDYFDIHGFQA